ncbi:hypothetical protein GCM10023322_65560 [Rugosimonospora acidiphila]|uniref:Secreted protein n=1 Tax=Rugosimonospora acidiphila TaxID=556531 RepID=A0ABP9SKW4_9ACTN
MAAVGLAAAGVVTALSFSPSAQATPPTYLEYGSYNWNDQCLSVGHAGQVNHTWSAYYCVTVTPSGPTGPGLYDLYVQR